VTVVRCGRALLAHTRRAPPVASPLVAAHPTS